MWLVARAAAGPKKRALLSMPQAASVWLCKDMRRERACASRLASAVSAVLPYQERFLQVWARAVWAVQIGCCFWSFTDDLGLGCCFTVIPKKSKGFEISTCTSSRIQDVTAVLTI